VIATTRGAIDDIVAGTAANATVDIGSDAIVLSLAVPRASRRISIAANRPLRVTARRLSFEERTTQQDAVCGAELCCVMESERVVHRRPSFSIVRE